jgi:hypothetical protein
VQVDRTEPRRAGSRYIRSGLQNVELRPEPGIEIALRDLERFIGVLDVARFGLEDAVRLLEVEKRAPDIRRHGELRCFQGVERRVAPGPGRLHSASGRVAIENVPGRVEADDETVVEFRSHFGIALAVNFVAGKRFHVRTALAPVEDQLGLLNLDVDLSRPDFRPGHVRVGQAFVQVGMLGRVLQLAVRLGGHRFAGSIDADQLRQAQLGVLQAGLGID